MLSFFFFANKTTIFRPILTYTPHFHPLRSNKRRVDKVMPHIKALRVNPPYVFVKRYKGRYLRNICEPL